MKFDKNGILNRAKAAQQTAAVMDEGLRAYMLKFITTWQQVYC